MKSTTRRPYLCVTRAQAVKAERAAEAARDAVPAGHVRIRERAYHETLYRELMGASRRRAIDATGRACYWYHEVNLGRSRRWADYMRAVEPARIEKQTVSDPAAGELGAAILDMTRGYTSNLVVIYR